MNAPKKPQNLLVRAGIFGALGTEFVGLTLAGVWAGSYLDKRFDIEPFGLLVCLLIGMFGASVHIVRITRRFLVDE